MPGDEKWIDELVGVFSDPIIVMPGGWGDTLPSWIKEAITLERLVANMEAIRTGVMMGTDAEACAYLYTAGLTNHMGHDWTQIYLYIASKVYEKHRSPNSGVKVPEDIRVESLDSYQMGELKKLKSWIYESRVKHRKTRAREDRKERGRRKEPPATVQMAFDLGLDE